LRLQLHVLVEWLVGKRGLMLSSDDSCVRKLRVVDELPIVSLQFLHIRLICRGDVSGTVFSINAHRLLETLIALIVRTQNCLKFFLFKLKTVSGLAAILDHKVLVLLQ
jgi:hypothetical protein